MIYLIITTSINNKVGNCDSELRKNRYIDCIKHNISIINKVNQETINRIKNENKDSMIDEDIDSLIKKNIIVPIVVENNGVRETFLDGLCDNIYYTDFNKYNFAHKGINELMDIKELIKILGEDANILEDYVIKLTGRYKLLSDKFLKLVLDNYNKYDVFMKFFNVSTKEFCEYDCVMGLFCIKAKYLKRFTYEEYNSKSAEIEVATFVKDIIDRDKIYVVRDNLDLECCFADNLEMLIV